MSVPHPRKKILIVMSHLFQGGLEKQVSYLFENLDRRRFEVHLGYFTTRDIFFKNLLSDPHHAHLLGSGRRVSFDSFFALCRLVRKLRPDIVHCFTQAANHLGGLASFFVKIPALIFSVRTTQLYRMDHWLYRNLKRRAQVTLVNSQGIKNELVAKAGYLSQQILITPNFLDTQAFRPASKEDRQKARLSLGFKQDEMVLGQLGRICPQKNQQGTLRALQLLRTQHKLPPKFRMLLMGQAYKTDYAQETQSLIKQFELEAVCQILKPTEQVATLYQALDGIFHPSQYEGLSNVILEAQASGTLVALSKEGDNDNLVIPGTTGIRFSASSDESTAQGLLELIKLADHETPLKWSMLQTARGQVVQHFSIGAGTRCFETIYENVLTVS